jgi:hypothetical protein
VAGQQLVIDPGITPNSHADLVLVPDRQVAVAVLENAESNLYATTIPKFDLLAMNIAAIATTGSAPQGMVEGYYLIFDLLAVAALGFYAVVLVRVLRRREPGLAGRSWFSRLVTAWRELVVPVVILVRLPDAFGEPWHTLTRSDVGLVAALVAALGLTTMAARAVFATRNGASPVAAAAGSARAGEESPSGSSEPATTGGVR